MKMSLRFTAGALLALTMQAVCFAQHLHANQSGFQHVRSGPSYRPRMVKKLVPVLCPEQQLIAQRPSMINQAREVFCQGRFPASFVLIVSPWPAVPSTFMPLPFRSTSAVPPVVLDTALLPCSFLPPAAKETRSDCLCPDGCAPRGNARYIAATLAAATILQTGSASTDILLSPTAPSVPRTSSDSGFFLAIEADSRFPS